MTLKFTPSQFNPAEQCPQACTPLADGRLVCRFEAPGEKPSVYVYDPPLLLALNVALACGRPLLLAGEPGCGKTTLARNVALVLQRAYYHHNISSRSQANELLWEVDSLRRLNDAYRPRAKVLEQDQYVEPGKLWWALAPESARWRGVPPGQRPRGQTELAPPPQHREGAGAVLLIDEIDKAEPDVPNDLLEVLDTRSFSAGRWRVEPERSDVMVMITTNLERELPGAFMRRCVVYRFPQAQAGWFVDIGAQQQPQIGADLAGKVAAQLMKARREAKAAGHRLPGTAEYLDALAALQALGLADVALPDAAPAAAPLADARVAAWAAVESCIFGKQAAVQPD